MSGDRIEGAVREGVGRVQDGLGGFAGDPETQARGKLNQAAGAAQNAFGKVQDVAGDLYADAADRAQDLYGELEELVKDRPLVAVGAGVIAGLVLGALLSSGRKTVYVTPR